MGNRGLFISIEGPDGSGKSTVIKGIEKWIVDVVKTQCLVTKEPGSPHDKACVEMRKLLLDPEINLVGGAELFLMLADRVQHVWKTLLPALNDNKIVITDRYFDSTYAYQGWGRRNGGPALKEIEELNNIATSGLIPDLTILIMVDPHVGYKRVTGRDNDKLDTFEKEKMDFREKVHHGFLDLYNKKKDSRNFFMIDSTEKSEQQCLTEVLDYLSVFIERKINLGD